MDFFELAQKRQSCRNYKTQPVEKEKLLQCIKAALIAPSACNGQPWHYYLVTGTENVGKLARCLQSGGMNKWASEVPAFAVVTETASNMSAKVGSAVKDQDYSSVDIGISAAHFVLQAEELGLSTCIVGWFNEKKLKELLGIDKNRVRLVLAVGYAKDDDVHRNKMRKPLDEVFTAKE
ncbi:MAG: nitroreductase family protein [Clostridia bacterium]|jgi:nitroreductase